MIEATDQIQNPVLPESPVAELPALSLTELPPQAPDPEIPQHDGESQTEAALTTEIVQLWQVHQDCQSAIKQETQQFRSLRSELGRLLHQMKALLAKPGRGGEWSGWLRERRIPRATADRLASKYERFLNPDGNCLTAQFTEPTEAEIQSLFDKIAPKLRRALRSPQSAYRFAELLVSSLALEREDTEEGFTVLKPSAQMTGQQPVPDETQVEPVPVSTDIPAEGSVESAGASMAL
jgi:hypothetical protein